MAKIFIRYARPDRPQAAGLARGLEAAGHRVWWDANLLANEEFTFVIDRELEAADAVVVIWTRTSAKSSFVVAEAQKARALKKLVGVVDRSILAQELPLPFNAQHCVGLGDSGAIVRAVAALASGGGHGRAEGFGGGAANMNGLLEGGLALIRRVSATLLDVARSDGLEPEDAERLRAAVADVLRAIDTFTADVSLADTFSIEERFAFRRVKEAINSQRPLIIKEKNWLDSYASAGVIEKSKPSLCATGRLLLEACG